MTCKSLFVPFLSIPLMFLGGCNTEQNHKNENQNRNNSATPKNKNIKGAKFKIGQTVYFKLNDSIKLKVQSMRKNDTGIEYTTTDPNGKVEKFEENDLTTTPLRF